MPETERVLFDEADNEIRDGDMVRVNGEHEGRIHITDRGYSIEDWPRDQIIDSLEILNS